MIYRAATRGVDKAIERFNDWLGSKRGFVQAVGISIAWNIAVWFGLDKHGFLYLFLATELGIVTQFTLAIINKDTSAKVDQALDELYAGTQTILKLARDEITERKRELDLQEAIAAQNEAIATVLRELQTDLHSRRRKRRA